MLFLPFLINLLILHNWNTQILSLLLYEGDSLVLYCSPGSYSQTGPFWPEKKHLSVSALGWGKGKHTKAWLDRLLYFGRPESDFMVLIWAWNAVRLSPYEYGGSSDCSAKQLSSNSSHTVSQSQSLVQILKWGQSLKCRQNL